MGIIDINANVPESGMSFLNYTLDRLFFRNAKRAVINANLQIIDVLISAGAENKVAEKISDVSATGFFNMAIEELQMYNAASFLFSRFSIRIEQTMLKEIIKTGSVSLISKIISDLPYSLNIQSRNEIWGLALAKNNFEDIAETLISANIFPADIELAAKVLLTGVRNKNEDIVRAFAWPNLMRRKIAHTSILHHAVAHGNEDIFDILVEAGSDINFNEEGWGFPFHIACYYGRETIMAKLVAKLKEGIANSSYPENQLSTWLTWKSNEGRDRGTALHLAVMPRRISVVKTLCEFAAESGIEDYPNIKKCDGSTAFHLAVLMAEEELVRYLISAGASLEYRIPQDNTNALDIAASIGDVKIAKILCEAAQGQGINDYPDIGKITGFPTSINFAIAEIREDMVRYFISLGIDINARIPWDNSTPLHAAAATGHSGIVLALLEAGADVNAISYSSRLPTPLSVAALYFQPEVYQLLIDRGARFRSELEGREVLKEFDKRANETLKNFEKDRLANIDKAQCKTRTEIMDEIIQTQRIIQKALKDQIEREATQPSSSVAITGFSQMARQDEYKSLLG